MGKIRDLFKKNRDTKVIFHAKMGTMKHKNGIDLTEADDINRWQEYWSGLPGDPPDPGIKPVSPAMQADSLLPESPGNTQP